MLHYALLPISSPVVEAQAGVLRFRAPFTGRITRVELYSDKANAAGDTIIDVNLGGASMFSNQATRPRIVAGQMSGFASDLLASVTRGQVVTVDFDTVPLGGIGDQFNVLITIDDELTTQVLGLGTIIADLYEGALARVPTASENTAATDALFAAYQSSGAEFTDAYLTLGRALFTSAEYIARGRTDAQLVNDLYLAWLRRVPEQAGFDSWLAAIAANGRAATIDAFPESDEVYVQRIARAMIGAVRLADAASIRGRVIAPTAPTDGQALVYEADSDTWGPGATSGRAANPMTAAGDIIVGGADGAETRLAKGSNGQVLKVSAGAVGWGEDSAGGGSVAPFDATHPDAAPVSPNAMDDEFSGSSLDPKWTWIGTALTTTFNKSWLRYIHPTSGASPKIKGFHQALPAAPFSFAARLMNANFPGGTSIANGLMLYDTVGGKLVGIHFWFTSSASVVRVSWYSSTSNFGTTLFEGRWESPLAHFKITDDNTNHIFSVSANGATWHDIYSMNRTAQLPNGGNRVGLYSMMDGSAVTGIMVDWFRRLS
jgi:hypothetical protein